MFLFRLIPTYGNWGGPGWSGHDYPKSPEETNWSVPPVDSMDLLFKEHDRRYQRAIVDYPDDDVLKYTVWEDADRELVEGLKEISMDGSTWDLPSNHKTWSKFYWLCAVIVFGFRVNFYF